MAIGDKIAASFVNEAREKLNLSSDLPKNLEQRIRKVLNEILDERSAHIEITFPRKEGY